MADLPSRPGWPKALAAGAVVLAIGLLIGRFAKSSGDYSGFWSGLQAPQESADAGAGKALASCPTPKCFTVYVAPWCPHCRDATSVILTTRDYLNQHNVHTNVIVGMDKAKALKDYARTFGPDTLLDRDGDLAQGGVPHFYVTDKAGHVLRDQAGVPEGITDPKEFAGLFGLP
jgi:hypothetical protein